MNGWVRFAKDRFVSLVFGISPCIIVTDAL